MSLIPFPYVPIAPGVPPVARDALNSFFNQGAPLIGDAPGVLGQLGDHGSQWGVYLNGQPALVVDSFGEIEPVKEYRQLDYPVEEGAFQTYNKVETPADYHILVRQGGTLADRTAFITAIEGMAGDLNLYDIVTPEVTYQSVNIGRYDMVRNAHEGVGLLTMRIFFREIRVTATQAFSQTATPAGADQKDDGQVQTTPPTAAQTPAGG